MCVETPFGESSPPKEEISRNYSPFFCPGQRGIQLQPGWAKNPGVAQWTNFPKWRCSQRRIKGPLFRRGSPKLKCGSLLIPPTVRRQLHWNWEFLWKVSPTFFRFFGAQFQLCRLSSGYPLLSQLDKLFCKTGPSISPSFSLFSLPSSLNGGIGSSFKAGRTTRKELSRSIRRSASMVTSSLSKRIKFVCRPVNSNWRKIFNLYSLLFGANSKPYNPIFIWKGHIEQFWRQRPASAEVYHGAYTPVRSLNPMGVPKVYDHLRRTTPLSHVYLSSYHHPLSKGWCSTWWSIRLEPGTSTSRSILL